MGFSVLVLNTNHNHPYSEPSHLPKRDRLKIEGSDSPEEHGITAWEEFIQYNPRIKHVAIVAHSYGGSVVESMAEAYYDHFFERVFSVAFTDATLGYKSVETGMGRVAVNYAACEMEQGVSLGEQAGIPEIAAGHQQHEWSSYAAMDMVFERLKRQLKDLGLASGDDASKAKKMETSSQEEISNAPQGEAVKESGGGDQKNVGEKDEDTKEEL